MKKKITLKNEEVEYVLKESQRAKRLRLAIYCDGSFVVTMPRGFSLMKMEEFILQKAGWVLKKLGIMRKRSRNLVFVKRSKRDYLKLKNQALKVAEEKIEKFNKVYGFKFNQIAIKNQKTRWGSCSKKGNLNYNYKIALLPDKLADYIIVHELCHLRQFNHSRGFWELVEKSIPNYREIRRKIREY